MTTISPDNERRIDPDLRELFIEAYDIIRPFFDQATMWAGQPHEHLAFMALHERFPQMSGEQVFIIVSAARRVFDTGRKPAS
ncbi:MAG TPA: hypothetical protein VJ001_12165 [Rhodocyclaceae bacterium]|nr:hypothetical protein [Rhodocyclaceae bacterium]